MSHPSGAVAGRPLCSGVPRRAGSFSGPLRCIAGMHPSGKDRGAQATATLSYHPHCARQQQQDRACRGIGPAGRARAVQQNLKPKASKAVGAPWCPSAARAPLRDAPFAFARPGASGQAPCAALAGTARTARCAASQQQQQQQEQLSLQQQQWQQNPTSSGLGARFSAAQPHPQLGTTGWRCLIDVAGIPTEVIGIDAANGAAQLQMLIVPGNPGNAKYYEGHLRELHAAYGGSAGVAAITHAGHEPELTNAAGRRLYDIHEQVNHKAAFMREHCFGTGQPPLVVLGHSIGGHVALHAVHQVEMGAHALPNGADGSDAAPPPRVHAVFAMMPFLWIDGSAWQISAHKVAASMYQVMAAVAWLLSVVPRGAARAFVRLVAGRMGARTEELTLQLLRAGSVRNNFYMARTEYALLDAPPDWRVLRNLGARLHVFGCPNDYWMTRAQFDEVVKKAPRCQGVWIEDASHGYCTSEQECVRLTQIIKLRLSNVFASGSAAGVDDSTMTRATE